MQSRDGTTQGGDSLRLLTALNYVWDTLHAKATLEYAVWRDREYEWITENLERRMNEVVAAEVDSDAVANAIGKSGSFSDTPPTAKSTENESGRAPALGASSHSREHHPGSGWDQCDYCQEFPTEIGCHVAMESSVCQRCIDHNLMCMWSRLGQRNDFK
ncbi:uncharacterized protein B0H18DRAFT_955321 [Fomitopsis serialis]|uniref:uncharacterized protein n=1 Tax=Fomitopsis serialis TaxID=139415 RepID=UPI0020087F26|nr:uncharacterized protein B0H18DRAFT_955321 [Neoantrodia serialis]KAH9924934.1 hypothetical protein B0H18DRAFT_955321 [Neoantrodia serialis]